MKSMLERRSAVDAMRAAALLATEAAERLQHEEGGTYASLVTDAAKKLFDVFAFYVRERERSQRA